MSRRSNNDSLEKNRGYWIYVTSLINILTGKSIDGYVRGARIYQDTNGDGSFSNQPFTISRQDGTFDVPQYTDASIPLISSGGTDISSGNPAITLKGFINLNGETIMNPFTTLGVENTDLLNIQGASLSASQIEFIFQMAHYSPTSFYDCNTSPLMKYRQEEPRGAVTGKKAIFQRALIQENCLQLKICSKISFALCKSSYASTDTRKFFSKH